MRTRITAALLTTVFSAFPAGELAAQSGAAKAVWETLMRKPLPEDTEPNIRVLSLPFAPAPPVPRAIGAGHTHAGPVFAYILQGKIENQVEPDPPEIYKPGGFFYEAPGHVHRLMRNLSNTEPASVIVFQAGYAGQAAPAIKLLLQESLRTTTNQEVSLLRLTLSRGTFAEAGVRSNPGIVYVLEGKIQIIGTTKNAADPKRIYRSGDLFVNPANRAGFAFKNASESGPAKLLLYQVNATAKTF